MSDLMERLKQLSAKATPGPWKAQPKRLEITTSLGLVDGPIMSYMVGSQETSAGMTVSLGSERIADHEFVSELVNAFRAGQLVQPEARYTHVYCEPCDEFVRQPCTLKDCAQLGSLPQPESPPK